MRKHKFGNTHPIVVNIPQLKLKKMLHFFPYLAQSQYPLLHSHNTALHHDEVIGHISIVDESTL